MKGFLTPVFLFLLLEPIWIQRFRSVPRYKWPFPFRFQNGENTLFTVETVAERNGPIFAKQALIIFSPIAPFFLFTISLSLT